jgi:hypothetical protein
MVSVQELDDATLFRPAAPRVGPLVVLLPGGAVVSVPLLMLVLIEPASLLAQPFPECRALHRVLLLRI